MYIYCGQNPRGNYDPLGLASTLTIATQADGSTTMGYITGKHSWLIYQSDDPKVGTKTFATFGNENGAQKKKGVNIDTELSKNQTGTPKYKATQMRSKELSIEEDKRIREFVKAEIAKGETAWTRTDPCSSFAANGWNSATGESIDPRNGTEGTPITKSSTPQLLGAAIKEANGNLDHKKVLPKSGNSVQDDVNVKEKPLPVANAVLQGNIVETIKNVKQTVTQPNPKAEKDEKK